jgi:hypothetical protein
MLIVDACGRQLAVAALEDIMLSGVRGTYMTWLDSGIRVLVLAQGTVTRWLRSELDSLKIGVRLSDGCIEELAREADHAARRALSAVGDGHRYLELLRGQVVMVANWVRRWTSTDEKVPDDDPLAQAVVRIARKYALPRPWKLTEPVAVEVASARIAWTWTAGLSAQAGG